MDRQTTRRNRLRVSPIRQPRIQSNSVPRTHFKASVRGGFIMPVLTGSLSVLRMTTTSSRRLQATCTDNGGGEVLLDEGRVLDQLVHSLLGWGSCLRLFALVFV